MVIKVGINGFGRVGRVVCRTCMQQADIEVVAINDPAVAVDYICYLMKYDSTHGKLNGEISSRDDMIFVNGKSIKVFNQKAPNNIPWHSVGVQYVIEASGMFSNLEKSSGHLMSDGVRRVIVTAPSVDMPMIILGVNNHKLSMGRLTKNTTMEEIIKVVDEQSKNSLKNIMKMSNDEAVSSDFAEDSHSCILDVNSTISLKPDYYKLVCWYENEFSYACRVVDLIYFSEKQLAYKLPLRVVTRHTIQQTELGPKRPFLQGSEKYPPKLVSSTTRTLDMKVKNTRTGFKKNYTSHSLTLHSTSNPRVPKKKQEVFKVWNDDTETQSIVRQNRDAFFQSCVTLGNTTKSNAKECMKAHERLEKVKQEFSKMVNITDELLKKSFVTKITNVKSRPDISIRNKNNVTTEKKENDNLNIKKHYEKPDLEKDKLLLEAKCDTKKANEWVANSKASSGVDYGNLHERDDNLGVGCTRTLLKQCNLLKPSTVGTNVKDLNNAKSFQNTDPPVVEISGDMNELKENITKKVDTIMGGLTQKIKIPRFGCKFTEECESSGEQANNFKDMINTENYKTHLNENVGFNLKESMYCRQRAKTASNDKFPRLLEGINCLSSKLSKELNKNIIDVSRIDKALKKHNIVLINYIQSEDSANIYNKQGNSDLGNQESVLRDETKKSDANIINVEKNDEKESKQNIITDECIENKNIEIKMNSKKNCSSNSSNTEKSSDENILAVNTFQKDTERMLYVCPKPKDDQKSNSLHNEISLMSSNLTLECNSLCSSPTKNNASKLDIYDKLDSASITDSDSSLHIDKRKSQIIDIKDLTNSLEDLARLDKICRIIEISDELSDKLFAPIANDKDAPTHAKRKWSFKDLCEKINLDEFCNKVFSNSTHPPAVW